MLEQSKELNPSTRHFVGDMRNVRLNESSVTVLNTWCNHVYATLTDLRAAFTTAWEHLRPGGIFITAPDFVRETFRDVLLEESITESDENMV